jgi:hypothetical protein
MRSLPFSLTALHLLFGDGEHLADWVIEPFGFRVAGYVWRWQWFHFISMIMLWSINLSFPPCSICHHFPMAFSSCDLRRKMALVEPIEFFFPRLLI